MNPLAGPAGPGMYSTRTDNLDLGSIAYGEGKETADIKGGAPLSKTADAVSGPSDTVSQQPAPLTGLLAMSDETRPITAGLDRGPGPGSEALMMGKSVVKLSDTLAQMLPFDTTGEIAILHQEALSRGN
jgi:hypothetical protein